MDLRFSRIAMFMAFSGIIFYVFVASFTSYTGIPNFPSANTYFNWHIIYTNAINTMGGSWGFFSGLENILIVIATPFIYIGNVFIYIGLVFVWIGNVVIYPFTLMPYPLNYIIPTIIGVLLAISIITSLRIVSSGIE